MCLGWADSWEELKTAAGTVTSVRAGFTQEKHMKMLVRPLVSEGVLLFQGPDSLRWEYKHPVQSILLLYKGKTRRFVQKSGRLVEDASANLQSMQVVVQEITQWLNGRFDDNPAFAARLEPGRKIVLAPRDESFARLIQRIEILLSDRPAVIKSVMIFESEDSFTKLDFKDVVLNQKLDDALFRKVR
ncbi:MAG: outer membrane lipoprotein carrier protein LolA [Proteobacteria bacterium]|nr:outer membrane lipoprotein carrier protein LolA [Pseudomonadota bacterium]